MRNGYRPVEREWLNRLCKIGPNMSMFSLMRRTGIPSGPAALFVGRMLTVEIISFKSISYITKLFCTEVRAGLCVLLV